MRTRLTMAAIAFALGAATTGIASAQTAPAATVDAIIGSKVTQEQKSASADRARVLEAIEQSAQNAEKVRKLTRTSKVDLVFLADAAQAEGGPPADIDAKLKERASEVKALRQEIEGNAILFHAIDSRQVLLRDVLAVEFGDDTVAIYVAAKPAG
ncbi:MAG: hypothetical protein WBA44_17625 [Mesorhizobium sp.]